jgi:hypothetical protein
MKIALLQIAIIMAAIVASEAQGPKKPPILDIPRAHLGCPQCNKKDPVVAEGLSPDYSTKLPECDRIEVFLLADDTQQETAADRFPIRPDNRTSGIIGLKDLKGAEASKLCSLWRRLTFDERMSTFSPPDFAYGLRFYHDDELVFETSVSFTTHNFYYPRTSFPYRPGVYSWHGFRSYDDAGKALFAFLDATLPTKAKKPKS